MILEILLGTTNSFPRVLIRRLPRRRLQLQRETTWAEKTIRAPRPY